MTYLVKRRALTVDAWKTLESGEAIPALGPVIVPAARWFAERDALVARHDAVGVLIEGEADIEPLVADLNRLPVVAVRIAKYADGRGISTGRLLRERFGFSGELRAVGAFLPDQVWELSRCGFDAFAFEDAKRAGRGLEAIDTFSEAYQASAAEPQRLFRRRAA